MIDLSKRFLNVKEIRASTVKEYGKTADEFRDLLRQYIGGDLVDVSLSWKLSVREDGLCFVPWGAITFDGEKLYSGHFCDCIGAVCYVVAKLQEEARHGDA